METLIDCAPHFGTAWKHLLIVPQTKQWVADLKMNGTVRDVAFTRDNRHLLSTGSESMITATYLELV